MTKVEHVSVVSPADIPRFKALGVIASVQPNFMFWRKMGSYPGPAILGPERTKHLFAWNDLAQAGATLIFGTDYPDGGSSLPDPITGLYCAIFRRIGDLDAPDTQFLPEQRLTPDLAVAAYTSAPADAIGLGDLLEKIAVGYEADLVIFTKDPHQAEAMSIEDNPLLAEFVGGEKT